MTKEVQSGTFEVRKRKIKRIGTFGKAGAKEVCKICNKKRQRFHQHHITYVPEKKVRLCSWCHEKITRLNKLSAKILNSKLNNVERIYLWEKFKKKPNMKIPDNQIYNIEAKLRRALDI